MSKILVTGGSGFIGTNLIELLSGNNYILLNLDKEKPANKEHHKYWIDVDILDKNAMAKAFESFNPDVVIHLAVVTDIYGKNLEHYLANTKGTENLIAVCKNVVGLQRVLFASTQYVCKLGYMPVNDTDYCPQTIYGQSKVDMEIIIKNAQDINFEWVIFRPTSIWGPYFKYPYRKFFDIIARGLYFDLSVTCTKTFGYIGNSVFQIEKLIKAANINKRTFYLGDKPAINISDWAAEINLHMKQRKIFRIPYVLKKVMALVGDSLKKAGIYFPMNSFRLKNMITDNIMNVDNLYEITGPPPYSRLEGTIETIKWMNNNN